MRRACAMLRRAADISSREHSRLSVRECNQPHAALEPPHESAACDHRATVVHRRSQSYVIAGSPPRLALIPLTPLHICTSAHKNGGPSEPARRFSDLSSGCASSFDVQDVVTRTLRL